MNAALAPLLLAVLGLPVVVGGVFLFARSRVEQHADQYAANVRRALAAKPAAGKPKELTRR